MKRKSWTTRGIVIGALALVAIAALAAKGRGWQRGIARGPVEPSERPVVEVVFVLDTTGSMTGMIEGAKAKIWQISSHIISGQPTPEVRIGLVAYRDKHDAYVTQVLPLTSDLDVVYNRLMSFRAEGGGDTPEHVNRALDEAIHAMRWSDGAMKMVFLVGDAPPHDDYSDVPDSRSLARQAADRQIVIHTVRCGQMAETADAWRAIATTANGRFTTIQQDGGVLAIATPMDDRLAELNRRLTENNILYGDDGVRSGYSSKVGAGIAAPSSTAADRARFFAVKPGKKMADEDILDDLADGRMDPADLEEGKLPEAMRPMSPGERKEHAFKLKRERESIVNEINALAGERDKYLRGRRPKGSLDSVVEDAITEQGGKHGIAY
jgi:Mg-chelatase subunit ChlD